MMKIRGCFSIAIAAVLVATFSSCKDEDEKVIVANNPGSESAEPFDGDGASRALFSIGDSKQVRFSRGNLQFQASTGTWRFAERQQDYIGEDNENISSSYDGWIDLFGWGTSGWESGAECYQPWSSSRTNSDYQPGGFWYNNLTGDYADADWAWHNAISNGGDRQHLWRTLSEEEWRYLLESRADARSKYGVALVEGVRGYVILPDSWSNPTQLPTFISGIGNTWSDNEYNQDQWYLMELAGAIFLPAAGNRDGTSIEGLGEQCYGVYWSSSRYDNEDVASCISFAARIGVSISWRALGCSVRPVQDK